MPAGELAGPGLAGPVKGRERIAALDVVRGFALLGILLMNIQSFAMISAAYFNPTAYGDLSSANYLVWLFSHLFADQKFMTIFAMLFGAGIVLMAERAEASGTKPALTHYRRMFFLILIGLAHAHLLFYGDILVTYGLSALVVFLLWQRTPVTLIVCGVILLGVGSGMYLSAGVTFDHWPEVERAAIEEMWAPPAADREVELAAYRGDGLAQARHRSPYALEFETSTFTFWGFWRSAGLMLIGMALYKLNVFRLASPGRFAYPAIAAALLIGLPLVAFGVYQNTANGWQAGFSFWFGVQYNYWGSIAISLGYIALMLLLLQRSWFAPVAARLAAVGRSALSNYVLQSVICAWVFYGSFLGLGLFGSVERVGQVLVVLGVWAAQLLISPWWLARFRYGPLEWLWRSLTYWRVQPLRRKVVQPVAG